MTTEVKQAAVYQLEDLDVQEVSVVDRGANKRTFLVVKRDQEKAVWSTAYVNDLPDSAFLHIKPGGRKDEDGKTVPRTLRMFPVRDDSGKIDLPHLRNAIARIPVANIAADLKTKLQTQARRMLEEQKEANMPIDNEDDFEKAVADAQSGEDIPADDIENTTDAGEPIEQADDSDIIEDDAVIEAQADKAKDDTTLAIEMSAEVKAQVGDMLAKMSDRMKALSEAVLAAREGEGALPDKMRNEIVEVMQALSAVAAPATEKTDAVETPEDTEKGLLAEAGNPAMVTASADEMARPIAMRYAMKMADMTKEYLSKAQVLLIGPMGDMEDDADDIEQMMSEKSMHEKRVAHTHAMAKAMGCMVKAVKAIGPFLPDDGGAPMQEVAAAYAYNPPQASQPAGVPSAQMPGANLKKAGRKISGARLDKLEAMHSQLAALLGELRDVEATDTTEKVSKATTAKDEEISRLASQVQQLTEIAKNQHAQLHSMKSSRPDTNVSAAGDFAQDVTPFSWPDDLNDSIDSDLVF